MHALAEKQIRASLVNTSQREAKHAMLPDLEHLDWDKLDYLGWHDGKRPEESYVVVEVGTTAVGVMLRAAKRSAVRRKSMCNWCQDFLATNDVSMYVARRAGPLGRRGDTVGTLICTDLDCSRNVRREPTLEEVGSGDPQEKARLIERRINGLRERSARFVANLKG
ncbi:MAG: FBP domain-containing protein [Ornithinimicrobium sp.]